MDTQWEYTTLDIDDSVKEELNKLGKENWEVVASGGRSSASNQLILKRPKRQQTRKRDDDYGYGR